jgi:hypothetical protein
MEEKRDVYRLLVGNPEGKRPLGSPRHRCMDNIMMDLAEIGWDGVDWIGLAQDKENCRCVLRGIPVAVGVR